MSVWADQERRRGHIEQVRENASRPGRAFAHYKLDAIADGYMIEPTVFDFGTSFTDLPVFTFAVSVDEDSDLPDLPPQTAVAGVYNWRKNADDFYTGAWCWFTVTWPTALDLTTVDSDFQLVYHLAWEGIASKDFIRSQNFPVSDLEF